MDTRKETLTMRFDRFPFYTVRDLLFDLEDHPFLLSAAFVVFGLLLLGWLRR